MKKIISSILSLVFLLTTFCTLFSIGDITVSAAEVNQISAEEEWNASWDSNTSYKFVYLTVEENGYYDLTIQDLKQTGSLYLYGYDMDLEDTNAWFATSFSIYSEVEECLTKNNIYLVAGHLYEIKCGYYNEEYENIDAQISLCFTRTDYNPSQMTLGAYQNITINYDTTNWMEFTTEIAGDYVFECNQYTDTTFFIFEKESGNFVDTINYYENNILVSKLKANTSYIITTRSYESTGRLVRLKVYKAQKEVLRIDVYNNVETLVDDFYTYDGEYFLYPTSFNYKVTYSDGSFIIKSYYELVDAGIWVLDVVYNGEVKTYDEEYLCIGNQPITIYYMNDLICSSNVYVSSYLEWCSNLNTKTDFDNMLIEYEDSETHTYYWKIRPDETNLYDFYSYDWDQIYVNVTIFDKNNNIIEYKNQNDSDTGFSLVGGNDYCLRMQYVYREYCYDDVVFHLEPNRDHYHTYSYSCDSTCNVCNATRYAYHSYSNDCDTTCNICGETRKVNAHKYSNACDAYCNVCNAKRSVVGHKYDSACDENCNYCGVARKVTHKYTTKTVKATTSKDGYVLTECSVCGKDKSKTTIYYPKTVKLSTTSYAYDGKTKKPTVTVKDSKGKTISSKYYTVSYASGRKNVGKYKVTVKFKGNYSGTKTLYFEINPGKTTLKKVTGASKSIKVTVNKKTTQVSGYQVQYSTSKKFTSAKTKTITSAKTTSATIKSLKAKKTYYVRVRTYKTVSGKKYYSGWSSYKSAKTK